MPNVGCSESWPFSAAGSRVFTNWGRTALEAVVRQEDLDGGTLLIPAFICPDSLGPLFEAYDLTPRFVDVDARGYHLDPESSSAEVDVEAVLLVHTFGLPVATEWWVDWCDDHDILLIEDCARALGAESATTASRVVGSDGAYAIYSLSKVTPLTVGGCVVSSDPGFDPPLDSPKPDLRSALNSLPETARAAVSARYPLSVEPRRLDEGSKRAFERYVDEELCRAVREHAHRAATLRQALDPLGFEFQADRPGRANYVLGARVPDRCDRDALLHYLQALHLPVKPLWPCPWPWVLDPHGASSRFPVAARLAQTLLGFRIDTMDDISMKDTIDAVRRYLGPAP